jgi:outer membrane protein insertion porin family
MTRIRNAEAYPRPGSFALPRSVLSDLRCRISQLWRAGLFLLLACSPSHAQLGSPKIAKIEIKHVGPASVSDELIRANIRLKAGDAYLPAAVDEDLRNLYGTGLFYNIRVAADNSPEGLVLTYIVQAKPRLTEIKFHGNTKFSDSKLRKKISSKPTEPLDERKLFTDCQEIQKAYQKSGYPRTDVKYVLNIDENAGRGTATFEILESPKVKVIEVQFVNATNFTQKKLQGVIKTRAHWMFSWLTGSGKLNDETFEEDQEKLREFYRDHGFIDFDIKAVQFLNPSPRTMIIRLHVYEGARYKVGSIKFTGNKTFTTPELTRGLRYLHALKGGKAKVGPNGLVMDVGDVFTPKGMGADIEAIEDFYGTKGYIDVSTGGRNLNVIKVPNTETGTMDLEFLLDEGQKSYIEKIEIRGNTKTKDKVIRRELAVAPGEVFDMVRVKVSKQRLEGLQYFEKVDARPESTDVPNRKNLVVGVDEKNTGNFTLGAGFSSVDSIVGFAEISQGNFDLFHPPTFTGGGQKFRLRIQLGTQRKDFVISFVEPWFLGRKLSLGVELYHRELNFQSVDNIYDETRTGARFSLTRALWRDYIIGSISYTIENVGIDLNSGFHGPLTGSVANPIDSQGNRGGITGPGPAGIPAFIPANVPNAILEQVGNHLLSRVGFSLAYDTRNSVQLPNRGQRTEALVDFVGGPLGGDEEFYKLELRTARYFKGLAPGHVLELVGRTGVAESLESTDVPFYERWYLGGLYSLRGFKYRGISPREPGFDEPVGGDTYWFGSAEYTIPIIERVRFAFFYDIGNVAVEPYKYNLNNFSDNWGLGMRLNLPIGPLRLDYGIPLHHDQFNSGSGRFQFGVGYTREL